jgi:hypothetical protein
MAQKNVTSHLKKTFWPNIFVEGEIQILGILEYTFGLNFASAAILNQNPFFEMACSFFTTTDVEPGCGA